MIESETENYDMINRVHTTLENLFGPKKIKSESLLMDEYLTNLIEQIRPLSLCRACKTPDDCFASGGTSIHIIFQRDSETPGNQI